MKEWHSDITTIVPGKMTTAGFDQEEIIRDFSVQEVPFLLLQGRRPTEVEGDLMRSILLSGISHGITGQSTLAVRMAADCRSSFLHALIAGFSVGAGVYHQGGLQAAMYELQALSGKPPDNLEQIVTDRYNRRERIIGFGHRYHKEREPRAKALMDAVTRLQFNGPHVALALKIEEVLCAHRPLPMNIEGARGSILLDLGFDPLIAHLFIILGRSSMFAAAYQERIREGVRPVPKLKVFDA